MSGLPHQLPWRRFLCVLHRLGYRPQKAGRGSARGFFNPARKPTTVSFREPHPHDTLRQTVLHNYIRKLLLTVDEFMALLEEC
jgi:predicted RNA binding protein YcfA (HicA-like mRNA interferase family)